MREFTLLGFVAHLNAVERDMDKVGDLIIAKACEMIAAEAKRVLGKGYNSWPELRPETIARKLRGDTPLLETGELRDSIQWWAQGHRGEVGSNNDKAVWHELGTSRIAPRPFLSGAANASRFKVEKMAQRAVAAVIAGRGMHAAEVRELMHLLHMLKHIARSAKDAINAWTDESSDGRRR